MDWWIIKQLRAMVMTDLQGIIPAGYFEDENELKKFTFHPGIYNHTHYSREMGWGYLAGKLGKSIFFDNKRIMSPRQTSASEVLMHLGFLASAEAMHGVTKQLAIDTKAKGIPDGNSGAVRDQMAQQHIPVFRQNLSGALGQYLNYLDKGERAPLISLLEKSTDEQPPNLTHISSTGELWAVLNSILDQFKTALEQNGLWKLLWDKEGKPMPEIVSQQLFFNTAIAYCNANNIDISPEANLGNGPVDFKLSRGSQSKIVVEIKLSTNGRLFHGYTNQLEIYKRADNTHEGVFVLIDVGRLGRKLARIQSTRTEFEKAHGKASDVWYIDCKRKESASKRK